MKTTEISTRRRFFCQAGAALSAPLAVAAAPAQADDAAGENSLRERLAALEDVEAIRGLNRSLAQHVNARDPAAIAALFVESAAAEAVASLTGLTPDANAAAEAVELAADRLTATATIRCIVSTETAIGPDCTLVQMARQQGEGFRRQVECRLLELDYIKRDGRWQLRRTLQRPA
jgi:ketosteroid isomerase-like protein